MKVNLKQNFRLFNGQVTSEIIADKICESLYMLGNKGQVDNGKKYHAYKLCNAIANAEGEIEITAEDASLIKSVCGDYLVAGAYGQVVDIIEGR